jgi:hypothetical protein
VIELRAHHLLCMLTFAGKGYSPGFVAKFRSVARFVNQGMPVKIVAGPDELCACVIAEDSEPHCYSASVTVRDLTAARDVGDMLGIVIEPGTILSFDNQTIAEMRSWFRNGITRRACIACQWHEVCTQLAESDFIGCTLGGTRS